MFSACPSNGFIHETILRNEGAQFMILNSVIERMMAMTRYEHLFPFKRTCE